MKRRPGLMTSGVICRAKSRLLRLILGLNLRPRLQPGVIIATWTSSLKL